MKKRNPLYFVLPIIIILLSFTACSGTDGQTDKKTNIYDFEKYKSSEVFNIEKIELNKTLADKCTSYKFTYLSDGLKINAYISIPASFEKTQKQGKCLLYNRGGNRDFGKLEEDTTANICTVCGRIVVASQYRGGGGSEGKDEFGGSDLNDVIKLVDLCENKFSFVDMTDFCVAGVSRGGVMTYPAARKDKRIKRLIAVSAVSDLVEAYESRDDMKTVLKETVGCTPQEKPEEYKKRSAVYWADEINVPVLIIHSKRDNKVPYKQAKALYNKLKDHTECKLITYDDDSHGVLHKEDYQTVYNWLNK